MAHMLVTTTGYATTPDAAVLDVTGDIDIRWRGALDAWATGSHNLVAKYGNVGQRSYLLYMTAAGRVAAVFSADGSASTVAPNSGGGNEVTTVGFVDGEPGWIRVTLDVDNGAGAYQVKFWYSLDDTDDHTAVSWTQLGLTTTGGTTTSIFAGTEKVSVGADAIGGTPAEGKHRRAVILDGLDGTPVFDADPSDPNTWAPDRQSFTEKANGATVTLQGDASLVGGGFPLLLLGVG